MREAQLSVSTYGRISLISTFETFCAYVQPHKMHRQHALRLPLIVWSWGAADARYRPALAESTLTVALDGSAKPSPAHSSLIQVAHLNEE